MIIIPIIQSTHWSINCSQWFSPRCGCGQKINSRENSVHSKRYWCQYFGQENRNLDIWKTHMKGIYFDLVASAVIWERFTRQSFEILHLSFLAKNSTVFISRLSFLREGFWWTGEQGRRGENQRLNKQCRSLEARGHPILSLTAAVRLLLQAKFCLFLSFL